MTTHSDIKQRKKVKAWTVIVDGKPIAVPYTGNVCGLAVFHDKREAQWRQKELMKSVRIDSKIVFCEIIYETP